MNNYLILINKQSKPVAIEAPVEPEEPNYGDCEMDASDCHDTTGERLYKMRMDLWTKDMKAYEHALQSAIADESKHIPFKDEEQIKKILLKDFYKGKSVAFNYTFEVGQTFQIPEGWRFRVEQLCKKNCPCPPNICINYREATLEKTSDRVENSAHKHDFKYTESTVRQKCSCGAYKDEFGKRTAVAEPVNDDRIESLEEELAQSRAMVSSLSKQIDQTEEQLSDTKILLEAAERAIEERNELLKAADEVITEANKYRKLFSPHSPYWELLENYNAIKTKK